MKLRNGDVDAISSSCLSTRRGSVVRLSLIALPAGPCTKVTWILGSIRPQRVREHILSLSLSLVLLAAFGLPKKKIKTGRVKSRGLFFGEFC